VRNADGDSAPAKVAVKRSAPPPLAPPRVVLRDRPATSDEPALPVRFVVTSAGPLKRVEVQRRAGDAGECETVAALDPRTAARAGDGFALDGEAAVPLLPEANRVRVLA